MEEMQQTQQSTLFINELTSEKGLCFIEKHIPI